MAMTQAECLRRYGYHEEAAKVESGEYKLAPGDLKGSIAMLELSDSLRELANTFHETPEKCRECGRDMFRVIRNTKTGHKRIICASCKEPHE